MKKTILVAVVLHLPCQRCYTGTISKVWCQGNYANQMAAGITVKRWVRDNCNNEVITLD
jgi:hypothetical protein